MIDPRMKDGFYSKKSALGVPNALILLMLIFFFVPFAGRGARMALQKTENNVKDWLPSDFRETEELSWFAKRFVSEQFIVATWEGCNEDSQRLKMFVSKLKIEQAPGENVDKSTDAYRARQLGAEYALFLGNDDFQDWGGKNEKWLVDENGQYFYITPSGRLYRWEGSPNLVSAAWRGLTRAIGSFQLDGKFVAAFGTPGTEVDPNPFWVDPRTLTAPLFKTIETGPDLVEQLAGGEDGPLTTPSEPEAGERIATARLTGTLFGPTVPTGFSWKSADLPSVLSEEKMAELPEDWAASWDLIIEQGVAERFGGDFEAFRKADPIDQAPLWYEFFDAIAVAVPPRQTCVVLTLSDPARRNLGRVIGRGMLGQPKGRLFEIGEECGIASPPEPTTAPPPFSWMAAATPAVEPVIHIGGPPVDNVAIDEEGTITLVRLIGYSLALGLGLSLLCLRSLKLMAMVFFVGGVSAMASLSLVWWCGASVDAILLTMPSLVYVLGMAGAIHIVNYYRDAIVEGGMKGAPERAITHAVMPCSLAALTTAIGLLSLCSSNILPIRKFGIFSAMGVMATLVLLYLYLPSALTIFPPKAKAMKGSGQRAAQGMLNFWEVVGAFILRRHWYVNAVCLVCFIGLGLGLFKIQTSVQLLKLFDSQSQIIRDYAWLEDNFGRLVPMELVVRFPESLNRPMEFEETPTIEQLRTARTQMSLIERADAVARVQQVLQDQFGYEGSDVVGRGMSAITFLKDLPAPSSGFSPHRSGANRKLEESRDKLLESDYLALETSDIAKNTELWRISLRLGALNDVDYGQFVSELRSAVEPIVAGYRCRQKILQSIVDRNPGIGDGIKGSVLILGYKPPDTPDAAVSASDQAPAKLAQNQVNDTRVLAETLSSCLVNETVKERIWHDPELSPLSAEQATSDKWADYLQRFDCVVLVKPHEDYDMNFVREHAPTFIDAEQMLVDIRSTTRATRVATGEPVELSTHAGEMDVVYTGIVPVVYKAQRTLLESLIQSVAWAFVLIAFVMACLLSPARSFLAAFAPRNMLQAIACGAISMIPNVFPVVIIFGIMGHSHSLVDIGSMMTASVAMGVAVDDTIHFLTWFRDGLRRGLDRRDAIFVAYKHVAPAMTQTTIIGGLGLSVFALSTFTPTQRFGTLMLALLAAALVGDLIFLPALLASPLGRIFTIRKKAGTISDRQHGSGDLAVESLPLEGSTDGISNPHIEQIEGEYTLAEEHIDPQRPPLRGPHLLRRDRSNVRRRI
ncbi:MAG: MMPL family transporter [Pirellulaceae bacterium]